MARPCPGPPPPTKPSIAVPKGACDSHVHVMGPYDRFPLSPDRFYTPPESTLDHLKALLDTMGVEKVVVAHASAYGADQSATLDAIRQLNGRARATIALDPAATRDEVQNFHRLGVRGVRMAKALGWEPTLDALKAVADRIVEFDWHIAIWPESRDELDRIRKVSEATGVRLVLEHLAGHCWDARQGVEQEGFAMVRSMLRSERVWLKIAGMYRVSAGPAPWPELIPFGRVLAAEHGDRLLWASDWPHTAIYTGNIPQSRELIDWLLHIGCDAAARQKILVDNPRTVYDFF